MTGEPSLTRRDVARKAGVDLDDVDRLVDLGLLHPGAEDTFSEADVLRARWIGRIYRKTTWQALHRKSGYRCAMRSFIGRCRSSSRWAVLRRASISRRGA